MSHPIATLSLTARRLIRDAAGAHASCPITVSYDSPDMPPTVTGESYYHTTLSGRTRVRHPNAYGYRTWYHASTLAVTVGVMRVRAILAAAHFATAKR